MIPFIGHEDSDLTYFIFDMIKWGSGEPRDDLPAGALRRVLRWCISRTVCQHTTLGYAVI